MVRTAFALAVLALAAAPAAARGDAISFVRGGDVWVMRADGGGARALTHGEHQYAWPSQADDGTLAATDADGWIYRMTAAGAAVGAPLPTADTQSGGDGTAEPPTHVRISPDGQRIAYDEVIDDDATVLWTPADATGLDLPNQTFGQEQLLAPSWIGSDQLLLSQEVDALAGGEDTYQLYAVGGGDDSATGWFADDRLDWASDFEAAASRDGRRLAVLADDAAVNAGVPTRVQLRLMTAAGPGQPPQRACDLDLPASEAAAQTSPTFSPDGTRLAWAQADGIHVAALGSLADCSFPLSVIGGAGATEPYWSAAAAPTGPGSGSGLPGGTARLTLRVAVHTPHRATLLRHGRLSASVGCSAACALHVELRLDAAGAKRAHLARVLASADHTLAKAGSIRIHLRLRPAAVRALRGLGGLRLTLRASAPGATAISRVLRPR